ncbi:CopD family protein [Domibacillus indicus]|uniref:copper resistance D family protein n=1 Tax=Domibacillus indicus TaxID=1437523 RepID=UPI00203BD4F9|nr:CopD family protein [Domibacillus indicus]MCM3790659.1 CopD family protein [Domibacillus indicus]
MAVLYASETLLYSCFSLLMGAFLIQLVPAHKKPAILVRERWLYGAVAGIALFAFVPAAVLILELAAGSSVMPVAQTVILGFTIGKAWAFTLAVALFFALYLFTFPVLTDKRFTAGGLGFILLLIGSASWSSHAASLTDWTGVLSHAVHFTAVSVWAGLLLMAGWFARDEANWLAFLKWFSPVAAICLLFTALSGFWMMTIILDIHDYASDWSLNYGQALLIKHLLVLPVLLFAFINGFLFKRKLQERRDVHPKPWIKAESLVLLLIFGTTAFLGQQEPPHAVSEGRYSPLFAFFYNGSLPPALPLYLGWSPLNVLFMFLALVFLAIGFWGYRKKEAGITFFMSMLLVFSLYLALITGLSS